MRRKRWNTDLKPTVPTPLARTPFGAQGAHVLLFKGAARMFKDQARSLFNGDADIPCFLVNGVLDQLAQVEPELRGAGQATKRPLPQVRIV